MSTLDFIMNWEQGTATDNQVIDGFAKLVKSGMAWTLQGIYGRFATSLIDAGYINRDGDVLKYSQESDT